MDRNETSPGGHDGCRDGLHVDIARRAKPIGHPQLSPGPLPRNRGRLIRDRLGYLTREATHTIDVYEERHAPGGAPRGPSTVAHRIGLSNTVVENVTEEPPVEAAITLEELGESLAEATGTTPEEIDRGADEIEFEAPEVSTVVDG